MEIKILEALPQHIPGIYSLVEELAVYEKARDEMWLTLEEYRSLYEENAFEAIVAIKNDVVIGTCIFYLTFSTWKGKMLYLEDFVVKESERRSGVGHLLFEKFNQIAKEKGCALTKWQVLNWNTPAINFYTKYDAIIDKDWWNCKIVFNQAPKPSG